MVMFRNQKYACLNCLRGHRASTCEHKNRILLQVGKRGRRPQAESGSRLALVRNADARNESGSGHEDNKYKVIRVTVPERISPNSSSPNVNCACGANTPPYRYSNPDLGTSVNVISEETPSNGLNREASPAAVSSADAVDDSVVFTEKYVFVHVGGNLFRRETRPDVGGTLRAAKNSFHTSVTSDHSSHQSLQADCNHLNASHPANPTDSTHNAPHDTIPAASNFHTTVSHVPRVPHVSHVPNIPNIPDVLQNTFHNSLTMQHDQDNALIEKPGYPNQLDRTKSSESTTNSTSASISAPLVIAPMQYVEYGQQNAMNLLNKIGVSAEEANQFWADDLGNLDLLYASQCAIPGQCKCGEGCKCADCYEHNGKHQ